MLERGCCAEQERPSAAGGLGRWARRQAGENTVASGQAYRRTRTSAAQVYELYHTLTREFGLFEHAVDQVVEQLTQFGRLDLVGEGFGLRAELVHELVGLLEHLRGEVQMPNARYDLVRTFGGGVASLRDQVQQL